jgi:hypothetical protein
MPGDLPTADDYVLKVTRSGAVATLRWAVDLADNSQGSDVNNFGDDGGGVQNNAAIRMFFDATGAATSTQDGEFQWVEQSDLFLFKNIIQMESAMALQFGGTGDYIHKSTDLKVVAAAKFDVDAAEEIVLDWGASRAGVIFQENNVAIGSIKKAAGNDLEILSGATSALVFTGAAVAAQGALSVAGDLTVTGNDIISSSATAITLDGADVEVVGDLTVTGSDITTPEPMFLKVGGDSKGLKVNATHLRPTDNAYDAGFNIGGSGKPFKWTWTNNLHLSALSTAYYVALKADDDQASTYTLTLPANVGNANEVLTTTGVSGVLTWTVPAANAAGTGLTYAGGDLDIEAAQTVITSVTNTALVLARDADNDIDFATDNNIIFRANGADQIKLVDGVIAPVTDGDIALGTTALRFSDLFLAEGGVINWDNGDLTLTQVGDVLTLGGDGSPTLTATLTNA